ncbi:MAG: UDP-N-acetylglucosamine 2-epimerase, partial [Lentisphaerae bacterium]|nr:UDP-N-acetylglucosamine 2-epimerase [Lentisphaerota bacterium]
NLACLKSILSALAALPCEVVFPVHPRTRKVIDANASVLGPPADNVRLTEPLGYLDVIMLLRHSRMLLTDSGGMQKEAFFLGVPCITLRDETEWPETVDAGWNCLVGSDTGRILAAVEAFEGADWSERAERRPQPYGDGHAARKILDVVRALLGC